MKTVPANTEVYVWQGAADMRAGFERLASLVQEHMQRSVLGGRCVYVCKSLQEAGEASLLGQRWICSVVQAA